MQNVSDLGDPLIAIANPDAAMRAHALVDLLDPFGFWSSLSLKVRSAPATQVHAAGLLTDYFKRLAWYLG